MVETQANSHLYRSSHLAPPYVCTIFNNTAVPSSFTVVEKKPLILKLT